MAGRKCKPIQQHVNEGDPRKLGKHKLQAKAAAMPKTTGTLPPCPGHLKGRARKQWEFWADELVLMQLDAKCDGAMLEGACIAYSRAVTADLQIEKQGIVIAEPVLVKGEAHPSWTRMKKHPAVTVSDAAWTQVRHFCTEFGLSPAARARLSVAPRSDSAADIDAILNTPMLTAEEKEKIAASYDKPH